MFASPIDDLLPLLIVSSNRRQVMRCLACSHEQIGICGGAICRHKNLDNRHPKVVRCRVIGTCKKTSANKKHQEQANCESDTYPERIARKRVVCPQCPGRCVRFGPRDGTAVHCSSKSAIKSGRLSENSRSGVEHFCIRNVIPTIVAGNVSGTWPNVCFGFAVILS